MKKGILLVNLGSPDSPEPKDVKKYLGEFLMDERVIDIPYIARKALVHGIILKTRPKTSSLNYKKIWWPEGSPLIVISQRVKYKVQQQVDIPVALAMRYGSLTIKKGLQELVEKGVNEVLLFPLYPQFAMATTETITVLVDALLKTDFPQLKVTSVPAFYNKPDYIDVLADSISKSIKDKPVDFLLFSYHGVPERHIHKSDITKSHCKINDGCCVTKSEAHNFCYRHQCLETTRLVGEKLNLNADYFSTSFQSRLGFDPWLLPYTDRTIERLAKKGIKNMAVVMPAFVSDCIETLEEIDMEGQELFHQMGGKTFNTIPCLNDSDNWVNLLSKWINNWSKTSVLS